MSQAHAVLINKIESAIEHDQLILPSPPDNMLRIREALNDPDTSIQQLTLLLAVDPALAARIIKVANSAVYRRHQHVDNLSQAISCLGYKLLNTLAVNHALMQMFARPDKLCCEFVRSIQSHSLAVAKLSYAICKQFTRLPSEDAVLAGLVHDIGYLTLLQNLKDADGMDDTELKNLLEFYHPRLGAQLLRKWRFPDTLVAVAQQHETLSRHIVGEADLVDVVLVANLRVHHPNGVPLQYSTNVSAFERLGMPSDCELAILTPYLEEAAQILID